MVTLKEIKNVRFVIDLLKDHLEEVPENEKSGFKVAIDTLKDYELELEDCYTEAYSDSFYCKFADVFEY